MYRLGWLKEGGWARMVAQSFVDGANKISPRLIRSRAYTDLRRRGHLDQVRLKKGLRSQMG
jgi:hypothetical protein